MMLSVLPDLPSSISCSWFSTAFNALKQQVKFENPKQSFESSKVNKQAETGLFQFQNLKNYEDVPKFMIFQQNYCEGLRKKLAKSKLISGKQQKPGPNELTAVELIHLIDDISNHICLFLDPNHFLKCLTNDSKLKEICIQCEPEFSEYVNELNTDLSIYQKLTELIENKEIFDKELTSTQQYCALMLKKDMEKNAGMLSDVFKLPDSEILKHKHQVIKLNSEYLTLVSQFLTTHEGQQTKAQKDNSFVTVTVPTIAFEKSDMKSLPIPKSILNPVSKSKEDGENKKTKLKVLKRSIPQILEICDSEVIRKKIYNKNQQEIEKTNEKKAQILLKILNNRNIFAKQLNFPSFSHLNTHYLHVKTPETAISFLETLKEQIIPKCEREIKVLTDFKSKDTKISKKSQKSSKIEQWDFPYYRKQVVSEIETKSKQRFEGKTEEQIISEYLSLRSVINGLKWISDQVFGVKLEEVLPEPGEVNWVSNPALIRKFKVFRSGKQKDQLGVIYFDMYSRPGKLFGAANYTIQSCKTKIGQLPVCGISCDFKMADEDYETMFNNSISPSFHPDEMDDNISLYHDSLVTLLHEFGHAMHVILGQTEFQSTSGTRTMYDIVEVPSTLFENFAWDYRVLKNFAQNSSKTKVLPQPVFESYKNRVRTMFSGLENMNQIFLSLVDLKIYMEKKPLTSIERLKQISQSEIDTIASFKVKNGTKLILPNISSLSFLDFRHLVTYPSFYFSYLYCNSMSSHIWHHLFEKDPLSRESGQKFINGFLAQGGSNSHFVDKFFEKEKLNPNYFLKTLGK